MTIEDGLAAITASTTALTLAVGAQQTAVIGAVAGFAATTARVSALNLVDNTADALKPISTSVQSALDTKQPKLVSGENIKRVNGVDLTGGGDIVIVRSATSLNAVAYNDRGTLRAMSPEVDDSTVVEGLGVFMWVASKEEPDEDETCFTTTLGQWLLATPAPDLLEAWAFHDTSFADDWREDEPKRFAAYLLSTK